MWWEPKFGQNRRKFGLSNVSGVSIWSWRKAWNGGSLPPELKGGLKKGGGVWGQHMPVSTPGLDHFICWGVISSTSYFLFVQVGTNRLVRRLAATSRDMHRPVTLYKSQWVVAIPSAIFYHFSVCVAIGNTLIWEENYKEGIETSFKTHLSSVSAVVHWPLLLSPQTSCTCEILYCE